MRAPRVEVSGTLGGGAGGFYSHVGEPAPLAAKGLSVKEFRSMLGVGTSLRLRTDTEFQLKRSLLTMKKAYKDIDRLLGDR